MVDRANAFRQHFDLDQERKYKELNLYVLHIALCDSHSFTKKILKGQPHACSSHLRRFREGSDHLGLVYASFLRISIRDCFQDLNP
jgi:hypothetical protein